MKVSTSKRDSLFCTYPCSANLVLSLVCSSMVCAGAVVVGGIGAIIVVSDSTERSFLVTRQAAGTRCATQQPIAFSDDGLGGEHLRCGEYAFPSAVPDFLLGLMNGKLMRYHYCFRLVLQGPPSVLARSVFKPATLYTS
jgi:hypothetical protein